MWINIITSVTNIILTAVLVGYLRLGIEYAALATVISMILGSVLSFLPFISKKSEIKFTSPKVPLKDVKTILYNGSSEFFEGISGSVMDIFVNGIMLSVAGASGVAAMSVIAYIEDLLTPVLEDIIGTTEPIVSYNYGAKNYDRVSETFRVACVTSAVVSIGALIIMLMFPDFLVSLFSSDADIKMREIATVGLLIYAPSYLFTWFNYIAGTFFTALERPTESMILMGSESVVFPIIFFVVLSKMNGVFLAQTIAAFCTFLLAVYMWKRLNIKSLFGEKL